MTAKALSISSLASQLLVASRSGERSSAQWDALRVFLLRAVSAGLLFFSQIALARWMGASEYGLYVPAWTCVLVLGGLSHLGLGMTMMRLAPQYSASGDHDGLRGLLLGGRALAVTSAFFVAMLAWLACYVAGDGSLHTPLTLAFLCIPLYAWMDVQDAIGRGQGWAIEGMVAPYIIRPLILLLAIGTLHLADLPTTAETAMLAALAATAGAAIVQTVLIERRIAATIPRGVMRFEVLGWLKISLPLLAVMASEVVIQNADVLLLSLYRPSHEIGIYYAAAKTTALALFIQYAIGSAYAGRISAAGALDDKARVATLTAEAVRWTFLPTSVVIAGIAALGYPILSQFGEGFTDAYPLIFIAAVGILARSSVGPSEVILSMLGMHRACALAYATSAFVCVTLNLLLIPLWGVTGASIATSSALVTTALLNWCLARRYLGLNIFILANLGRR
ncbi:MAG: lipopolysaccharide biosynthesis protein [Hyphomicrobium sp.]